MTGREQAGELWRLGRFRARNPSVVIGRDSGFGFWQAWIPESNGGTVITRYLLQELLDKLEDLLSPGPRHGSEDSGAADGGTELATDDQNHGI